MTKRERLIEWLRKSGPLLESQIVGSGLSRTLNELLIDGVAEMIEHPTVKERGWPVSGVILKEQKK